MAFVHKNAASLGPLGLKRLIRRRSGLLSAPPIMGGFNDLSLEDFKPRTFLTSKKDKSKMIPLKSYTAPRDRSDGVALFSFPRSLDGKPAFRLEDQEVEFSTQGRNITLKDSFKLAKMTIEGRLDL